MKSTVGRSAKRRKPLNSGGSRKGIPNKVTTELREMILAALDQVGGIEYLVQRANETPVAYMTLLGKVLPLQVTGKDGKDLIPPPTPGVDWLGYPIGNCAGDSEPV